MTGNSQIKNNINPIDKSQIHNKSNSLNTSHNAYNETRPQIYD